MTDRPRANGKSVQLPEVHAGGRQAVQVYPLADWQLTANA